MAEPPIHQQYPRSDSYLEAGKECCKNDFKTVYFETYGCASNKSDMEIMLAILEKSGYLEVESPEEATIIIVNTCAVKKVTEDRMLERLRKLRRYRKPIIISGCLPRIDLDSIKKTVPDFSGIIDPTSISEVAEVADAVAGGSVGEIRFSNKPQDKASLPKRRLNRLVEIIPISEGCLGECTYCCTRFARGRLYAYQPDKIVERVEEAVAEGALEVQITAQDTACYKVDGYNLGTLLEKIVSIDGEFKVRVGMMNPDHASKIVYELIRAYRSPKVYKFLHIPVQSGSDRILGLMNRRYTVRDFVSLVETFRSEFPTISIATDLIVGFPGESWEDFESTVRLIETTSPDVINISKYAPRPGTEAAKMKQLESNVVASRSRRLSNLAARFILERNIRMIGVVEEINVIEKNRRNSAFGRTHNYKKVMVGGERFLGERLRVKVTSANLRYLCSEIASSPRV
ncbi:tRNA (N(6)-L-threonylcarbamoyladenosine(37)-C(2))-methylthiotransferase [Candidatus Bathyarchaeota archaeon]|nr:tRNA (N(6)-L-threonylcarbamoyladenosine(37)-C(2))-methylthiotransferase [Candidatus Bathyarchaeota archaeon]MBS7628753.1 tRNA (N(6)-L-threonylcarbamoyladenosine(37)-C(2))-methylthiotransferase [Candidatus Bathyarchaeota archaeon]